jgi:HEAT repeat protein
LAIPPLGNRPTSSREVHMRRFLLLPLSLAITFMALAGNPTTMWAADEKELEYKGTLVDDWIKKLKDAPNPNDRADAAIALGQLDNQLEKAIPPLIEALKDTVHIVRACAAIALGKYGPKAKEALGPICMLLNDKEEFVRRDAGLALVKISPDTEQMVRLVMTDLKGQNVDLEFIQRGSEIFGLIGKDPKESVPRLIDALKDKNVTTRQCSALALAMLGPKAKEAVPALIDALKDKDMRVRKVTTAALIQISPSDAKQLVSALIDALKDEDPEVRVWAAQSLGQIGPDAKEAQGPICELLNDKEEIVRHVAGAALVIISPETRQMVRLMMSDQKGPNVEIIRRSRELAGLMGRNPKGAVPPLIDALKDKNATIRRCSALLLKMLGPKATEAGADLVDALKDDDVHELAAEALEKMGSAAMKPLAQGLKNPDTYVRWRAALILERVGSSAKEAVPALSDGLND